MATRNLTATLRVESEPEDIRPLDDIEESLRDIKPAAEDASRGLVEVCDGAKEAADGIEPLEKEAIKLAKVLKRLEDADIKVDADGKDVTKLLKDIERLQKRLARTGKRVDMARARTEFDKTSGASRGLERALVDTAAISDQLQKRIDDLPPELREVAEGFQSVKRRGKAAREELSKIRGAADKSAKGLRGMASAGDKLKGIPGVLGKIKGALAGLGILVFLERAIRLLTGTITATDRQAKAVAQVEAALRSTQSAAGVTVKELQDLAAGLQDVTTFGDEVILEMQGVLLTFTNLGKDVLPEASERILDIATRMGAGEGGLTEVANSLGKVLNDPIRNLSSLSERGIQFTEVQKQMIVQLAESGDLLGAQKIILAELEKQFGGAARAARKTFGGALDAAKNAGGDFLEQVGEGGLAGAIERLANRFSSAADESSGAARRIGQVLGTLLEIVGGTATGIKAGFEAIAGSVGLILADITEKIVAIGDVIARGLGKIPGLEDAAANFRERMEELRGIVADFRENVASETESDLRTARNSLKQSLDNIVGIWKGSAEEAKAGAQGFQDAAKSVDVAGDSLAALSPKAQAARQELILLFGEIPAEAKSAAKGFLEAFTSFDLSEIREKFIVLDETAKDEIRRRFREAVDVIRESGGEITAEMVAIGNSIGVLTNAWKPVSDGAAESALAFRTASGEIVDSIEIVVTEVDKAGNVLIKTKEISREAAAEMTLEELQNAPPRLQAYAAAVKAAGESVVEAGDSADTAAGKLDKPAQSADRLEQAVGDLAQSQGDLATAQDAAGDAADRQAASFDVLLQKIASGDLKKEIGEIRAELQTFNEIDFSGLSQNLDAVIAKVGELAAALDAVDGEAP